MSDASPRDAERPLAAMRAINAICDEFEDAQLAGAKPAIEDYVQRVDAEHRGWLLAELLPLELDALAKSGAKVEIERYLRRFPEGADAVRQVFAERNPPLGAEQLLESIVRAGLLDAQVARRLINEVDPETGGNAARLGKLLVEANVLTDFQRDSLVNGDSAAIVLGDYIILDRIGRGGMGQVYKARHRRMERLVALKTLPDEVAGDPDALARFHREVKAAARLSHPNIVTAHDAREDSGIHYLVMEYIPGEDLSKHVKEQGPMDPHAAAECILQAARALEYAHHQGVIHRDIKPSNLLLQSGRGSGRGSRDEGLGKEIASSQAPRPLTLDPRPVVKVLDLGLARLDYFEGDPIGTQSDLTGSGAVMGTVDYMAPEQAQNTRNADHRSDIYSLGMTFYYLLTGETAYGGQTVMERLLAHREMPIPSLESTLIALHGVSGAAAESSVTNWKGLDDVFRKMVAKKPSERYQSMSQVVAELEPLVGTLESRQQSRSATMPATGTVQVTRESRLASSSELGHSAATSIKTRRSSIAAADDTNRDLARERTVKMTATPEDAGPQRPWRRWQWLAMALALIGLAASGIVYRIQTDYGTLVVEIEDEDIIAQLTAGGVQVFDQNDPNKKWTITLDQEGEVMEELPSGEYEVTDIPGVELLITDTDGLETSAREFKLTRNGEVRIRITAEAEISDVSPDGDSPAEVGDTDDIVTEVSVRPLDGGRYAVYAPGYRATIGANGLIERVWAGETTLIDSTSFGGMGKTDTSPITATTSGTTLTFDDGGDYRLRYDFEPHAIVVTARVSTEAATRDGQDGNPDYLYLATRFSSSAREIVLLADGTFLPMPVAEPSWASGNFVVNYFDNAKVEVTPEATLGHFFGSESGSEWKGQLLELDADNQIRFDIRAAEGIVHASDLEDLPTTDEVVVHPLPAGRFGIVAPGYRATISDTGLIDRVWSDDATLIEHTYLGGLDDYSGMGTTGNVAVEIDGTTLTFVEGEDYRLIYDFDPMGFRVRIRASQAAAERDGVDNKSYFLCFTTRFSSSSHHASLLDTGEGLELPAADAEVTTSHFELAVPNRRWNFMNVETTAGPHYFNSFGGPYSWSRGYLDFDVDNEIRFEIRPPAEPVPSTGWTPTAEQQAFIDHVATLSPEEQVEAVRLKMIEVNPDFDGMLTPTLRREQLVGLRLDVDHVSEIWPVRACANLEMLHCASSAPGEGRLSDLSPLAGLRLEFLHLSTSVSDLSPLRDLPLNTLQLRGCRLSDFSQLSAFARLHTIQLSGYEELTDADLAPLANVPLLTNVYLAGCPAITDEGLVHLHGLSQLHTLQVRGEGVTDAGILALPQLDQLVSLDVQGTSISDELLAGLAGHSSLQELNIANTQVTDAGVRHLASVPTLDTLAVGHTQITGEAFESFATSSLKNIDLFNARTISDAALVHLAGIASLEGLDLRNTPISDAGLAELHRLPQLKFISLPETVTEEAARALLAEFPECELWWNGQLIE